MPQVITTLDVPLSGELKIAIGTIVTPSARDLARDRGVPIVEVKPDQLNGIAPPDKTIALGADHGGFEMKEALKSVFAELRLEVRDVGVHEAKAADYPDIACKVAELVAEGKASRGVIVDGAGIGSAMAANKVPGIRAALCYDKASARNSREHNHANVLTLGGRMLTVTQAEEVLRTWLATPYGGGRHGARVDKITEIEKEIRRLEAHELDRLVAQIGEEILARIPRNAGHAPKAEGLNIGDEVCPGCTQRCAQTCARKTRQIIAAGADRISASEKLTHVAPDVAALIDHTMLKPEATRDEIEKLAREAKQFKFASVCVNPYWIPLVAGVLAGSPVKTCTVVAFPLGATPTPIKVAEAKRAIADGATEVDMVINVGALRSGDLDTVLDDVRAVTEACHAGGAIVKVIIETALLDDNQKVAACSLCKAAGADFVKTSTGFSKSGATAHDVALMRSVVGPDIGVKASGGIRTFADLQTMTKAGANRIGASASVKIIQEARS